jgi:hypothetical protein
VNERDIHLNFSGGVGDVALILEWGSHGRMLLRVGVERGEGSGGVVSGCRGFGEISRRGRVKLEDGVALK